MKKKPDFACIELDRLNPQSITTVPHLWITATKPLLRFAGHVYQVVTVRMGNATMRHVYRMELDGTRYLKRQGIVYACEIKVKNWQQKALIAAGHTKEDITAAICAARLRGEF